MHVVVYKMIVQYEYKTKTQLMMMMMQASRSIVGYYSIAVVGVLVGVGVAQFEYGLFLSSAIQT